jgi:lipopolysaccharide transport system permease protein
MNEPGRLRMIWGQRSLLAELTLRDFRAKYAGSLMGIFWSVINPLMLLAIFTFVFSVIFEIRLGPLPGIKYNALYIFCGVLPWIAFQESVQRSCTILIDQKNLVTRVQFPSALLPASVVGSSALGMMIGLIILLAADVVVTGHITVYALLIVVLIVLQIGFTLGVAWFAASVNVFFRDLQHLLPVGLLVWMYATPIFYSPEMVRNIRPVNIWGYTLTSHHLSAILTVNPMHHLIAGYRAILLEGRMPWAEMEWLAAFAIVSLSIGAWAFARGKSRFADVL